MRDWASQLAWERQLQEQPQRVRRGELRVTPSSTGENWFIAIMAILFVVVVFCLAVGLIGGAP